MGLWQNLVVGYEKNPNISRVDAGGVYPLSSTTISNQTDSIVIISLDANGTFKGNEIISKHNDKKGIERQILPIPVTQESLNRTRESYPHPLFDQREYVFPEISEGRQVPTAKNNKYKEQLQKFSMSPLAPASVKAVFRYVSDPTRDFSADLPDKIKSKTFILFRVLIPGKTIYDLWKDQELFQAWHKYYSMIIQKENSCVLDCITGLSLPEATFHPKKIFSSSGNAKLISANDKINFTFRGRFTNDKQAVSIGYEPSQKAHQFFRYLIANNGIPCGEQVIVPFVHRNGVNSLPPPPVRDEDSFWNCEEDDITAEIMTTLGAETGIDYAKAVSQALLGLKLGKQWESHAPASIAILEAATPGRLSITYYREFSRYEYLEKIQQWHERCKWPLWRRLNNSNNVSLFLGAPSFDRILQAAFGWPKSGKDESYEKLKQKVRIQLIRSVFDGSPVPSDYLANAVQRVSTPLGITSNSKFDRARFLSALATTCALLRHYYYNTKESFNMSIDLNRTDRDYLYGRLLGAADKLEEYALLKKDNSRSVTAAIRYMQTFSVRPFTTWRTIHDVLLPYVQQVKESFAFHEIQAITEAFSPEAFADDSPLSGLYLAGYYHERKYLDDLVKIMKKKIQQSELPNDIIPEQE